MLMPLTFCIANGVRVKMTSDQHFDPPFFEPLGIDGHALVTFPKYDRATRWWKQNKSGTHQIANLAAQNRK